MRARRRMNREGETLARGGDLVGARAQLVESIAERIGSAHEAAWIVDHVARRASPATDDRPAPSDDEHDDVRQSLDGRELERAARGLADRRAAGEPLQYVLGRWPFRSLELRVDRRALIPRPETEWVVEVSLGELDRICAGPRSIGPSGHHPVGVSDASRVCVDLGTGTGAIALSLAVEGAASCPGLEVWATDRSADALEVAGENLRVLGRSNGPAASRVSLAEGSWFDALPSALAGRVDVVVSNPPYVAESEFADLDPTVSDWEPRSALVAARGTGGEGMAAIEAIVDDAPRWLHPSGALVVEIAPTQAEVSVDAARLAGFGHVRIERDLAGRPRMLVARC